MASRSFDTRSAAVAFAKQVSMANKTSVRVLEREGIYFVEGEYFSSDKTSIPDFSEKIPVALKAAYISNGLPLAKHIAGKAITSANKAISASSTKQKKQKKVPIKERGLKRLNRYLIKVATDQEIENSCRIEDAREKLLAKRLLLESLENRVAPPPITLNVFTSFRGAIVGASQKQSNNSICPRCGGDGGVNGGCDKCGGTGWI